MSTSEEVENELVRSVVEFTGCCADRARKLLQESNWHVPEAVTRFYLESESQPRQQTMHSPARQDELAPISPADASTGALRALISAIKSCLGWAGSSCWNLFNWFLFGSHIQSGTGCLAPYFNSLTEGIARPICRSETFQEAATRSRARDNRKVMIVYLASGSDGNFDSKTRSVICAESVASMINEQFIFWAGDVDFSAPLQLLRALPVRCNPLLVALVSVNSTELKIVGACGGPQFTLENAIGVLHKAQEAQDRLFAEDEQFRINRTLRETQDREFEESLERDRLMEEERQRKRDEEERIEKERLERAKSKDVKKSAIQKEKEAALSRVERARGIETPTTIVVRFPGGVRIEKKFDKNEVIGTLYDWVLCCGLLHAHASEVGQEIRPGKFYLSTTFPARKLEVMSASLLELDLVPNAVLAFTNIDDESDSESIDVKS